MFCHRKPEQFCQSSRNCVEWTHDYCNTILNVLLVWPVAENLTLGTLLPQANWFFPWVWKLIGTAMWPSSVWMLIVYIFHHCLPPLSRMMANLKFTQLWKWVLEEETSLVSSIIWASSRLEMSESRETVQYLQLSDSYCIHSVCPELSFPFSIVCCSSSAFSSTHSINIYPRWN